MKQSCIEKLWKPIIRPSRHNYQLKDLGNQITMVIGIVTKRKDFEIVNKSRQIILIQFKQLEVIVYIDRNQISQVSIVFLSSNQDQLVNSKHSKQLHCIFKGTKILKSFDGNHNSNRPNDTMKDSCRFCHILISKQSSDQPQSSRDTKLLLLHNQREKLSFQYDEVHQIMTGGEISNNEQNISK